MEIKKLQVTMTYTVGFSDIDAPDDIYEQLKEGKVFKGDSDVDDNVKDWLDAMIKEHDAFEWQWEIDDIS